MLDIELIYLSYPRHVARRAALASIERAIQAIMRGETGKLMSRADAAMFLHERVQAYAQSFAGQRGALTPYPATWMNQGRYMDDPNEWEYISPDEEKRLARNAEANVGVWRPQ